MDEKSQWPEAVIDGHHHHAFFGKIPAVVFRLRSGTEIKGAAVNPDHDR